MQSNYSSMMKGSGLPVNLHLFILPPVSTVCDVTFLSCFVQNWQWVLESRTAACPLCLSACTLCFGGCNTVLQPVGCHLLWPHAWWSHLRQSLTVCRCSRTGEEEEHWLSGRTLPEGSQGKPHSKTEYFKQLDKYYCSVQPQKLSSQTM